tara:strand:+ start:1654 stop:2061 length:408 start_codon:yes stop_codon:yes gene_type:complete
MEQTETAGQIRPTTKSKKILYWSSTGLLSAMMLMGAIGYFTSPEMQQNFVRLGLPDYFRIELGAAKILGVLALLIPQLSKFKEWAYAGFSITLISAVIAHISIGDPVSVTIAPVIALILLLTSYFNQVPTRSINK